MVILICISKNKLSIFLPLEKISSSQRIKLLEVLRKFDIIDEILISARPFLNDGIAENEITNFIYEDCINNVFMEIDNIYSEKGRVKKCVY